MRNSGASSPICWARTPSPAISASSIIRSSTACLGDVTALVIVETISTPRSVVTIRPMLFEVSQFPGTLRFWFGIPLGSSAIVWTTLADARGDTTRATRVAGRVISIRSRGSDIANSALRSAANAATARSIACRAS